MKIDVNKFRDLFHKYPILEDTEDEIYADHECGYGVEKDHLIEFAKTILALSEEDWKTIEYED